mmetsp:Transcript_25482/g.61261  ORF Transcript_25482/g.61261 Transcript_25482/m.61261 type:complete len:115 (+) Transcript_25482:1546-1890(+)
MSKNLKISILSDFLTQEISSTLLQSQTQKLPEIKAKANHEDLLLLGTIPMPLRTKENCNWQIQRENCQLCKYVAIPICNRFDHTDTGCFPFDRTAYCVEYLLLHCLIGSAHEQF